ncbi:MAG TPA: ribosome biogenesis factor YjgA [Steroidobacteraceae bacterium]|jgi:ribosome-associated protein|nr:ribosome biogenesis factor YjgA [Steroidobacteraceae bacterium]
MQEDDESQEFGGRPSKSARKREAAAAQDLGERLIALKEAELTALELPEKLFDAIMLAKRITSRGGLARQRQYIGKLMRDVDPAPIEAALNAKSRGAALDAERHKRIEDWRARLLAEGPPALDELTRWCPGADRKALSALVQKATGERVDSGSREAASRELFRTLRTLFDSIPR